MKTLSKIWCSAWTTTDPEKSEGSRETFGRKAHCYEGIVLVLWDSYTNPEREKEIWGFGGDMYLYVGTYHHP
jgi:hypothetical protein